VVRAAVTMAVWIAGETMYHPARGWVRTRWRCLALVPTIGVPHGKEFSDRSVDQSRLAKKALEEVPPVAMAGARYDPELRTFDGGWSQGSGGKNSRSSHWATLFSGT